jgi:hypothetical protein
VALVRPLPERRLQEHVGAVPQDLDLTHLSLGELLVIWAFRTRLARGPSGLVAGFRLAFGLARLEAALASFESLFGVLQHHCRCDIGLHAPACRCVSPDEMTIAGVIAALQAGAPLHAQLLAARLVDAAVLDGFLAHARTLAASLKEERLHLPVRPPACCAGSRPPALH